MIKIYVTLPSGRSEALLFPQSSTEGDLKIQAQQILGHRFLKLIAADGHIVADTEKTLQATCLADGHHVTAVLLQPKVTATSRAFAMWCKGCKGCDGVIAWGQPKSGGDSSSGVCNRSKAPNMHSLPSLQTGRLLLGAIHLLVATALKSKITGPMCSAATGRGALAFLVVRASCRLRSASRI
eukprot:Skav230477  [mRNA]  locus=scaffold1445:111260:114832:- [translate_table: standard]